jgi:hypothetical protein
MLTMADKTLVSADAYQVFEATEKKPKRLFRFTVSLPSSAAAETSL